MEQKQREEEKKFELKEPEPPEESLEELLLQLSVNPHESGRIFNRKTVEDQLLSSIVEGEFKEFKVAEDIFEGRSARESTRVLNSARDQLKTKLENLSENERDLTGITDARLADIERSLDNVEGRELEKKIIQMSNIINLKDILEEIADEEGGLDELSEVIQLEDEDPRLISSSDDMSRLTRRGLDLAKTKNKAQQRILVGELEQKERSEGLTDREKELLNIVRSDKFLELGDISVLKTLTEGVHSAQSKVGDPTLFKDILNDILSEHVSLDQLRTIPVGFTTELHSFITDGRNILESQEISLQDQDKVNAEFGRELHDEFQALMKVGINPSNLAEDLLEEIQSDVKSESLKTLLSNTIRRQFQQTGLPTLERTPFVEEKAISAGNFVRIESSLAKKVANTIEAELIKLERLNEMGVDVKTKLNNLIKNLNESLKQNGISTISKSGARNFKNFRTSGATIGKLKKIRKFISELDDPTISYFRIPVVIKRGNIREESILNDIRDSMKSQPRKLRAASINKPHAFKKMGHIKISHDYNNNITEIQVPKITKISDLLKLAHILSLMNGRLENLNGKTLLRIIKKKTREQSILGVLEKLYKDHSGHDFSLIFRPSKSDRRTLKGGLFLNSLLPVIANQNLQGAKKGGALKNHILNSSISDISHFGGSPHTLVGGSPPNLLGGIPTKHLGGKVKASSILGGLSSASGALSAFPVAAPFTIPFAALTGLAGGIARIFGGGFNHNNVETVSRMPHRLAAR